MPSSCGVSYPYSMPVHTLELIAGFGSKTLTPTPMAVGQIKVPPESYGAFWPSTSISQRNPSNMPDQRQNLSRGHFARNALREKYAPQHILSIRCSPYRRSTPTITVPYLVLFEAIKTGDGLCRQQFEVQGYGIQGSRTLYTQRILEWLLSVWSDMTKNIGKNAMRQTLILYARRQVEAT